MKAVEFNKLTGKQLEKLDFKELSSLVSAQAKTSNKRLERIRADKTASKDAVRAVNRSGGKFKAKGKNKTQLIREAKRIQNFNKAKTGTVAGARAVTAKRQKQITGQTATEAGKEARKKAESEAKAEIKRKKGQTGKKTLTKKEREKVKAAGRKAERQKRKEVEKKVKETVDKFNKARQDKQKKDRGPYYYAEPDGKGAGATGDDVDMNKWMSTTERYEKSDRERQEKLFKKEEAYQRGTPSPFTVNDTGDPDFTVAKETPFI